jgi:hypothetical protein
MHLLRGVSRTNKVYLLKMQRLSGVILLLLFCSASASAQQLLTDLMDTSTTTGRGLYSVYQKYNALKISIYIQPQFQYAESRGAETYNGGDFDVNSDNRFSVRRGRLRAEYIHSDSLGYPTAQLAFQFDATERGVFVRDMFGRVFENKLHIFSVTGGIFARPFGYEINLGSSDRETPERGRMSQILMRTERDLGFMLSIEPRGPDNKFRWLKFDIGLFNGQGLPGLSDYDSHKDIITRLACKALKLNKAGWKLSGGLSGYFGGIESRSPVIYSMAGTGNISYWAYDSATAHKGSIMPRRYYGADVQLKIPNRKGATELRAECILGQQTATDITTETPGIYPLSDAGAALPLYTRNFSGAYFYLLQHLASDQHQLVLKYDWYDPNTKVAGLQLSDTRGFTPADIKFSTLGIGYVYYINANIKLMLYYEHVQNELTAITGYGIDRHDNTFTTRLQFRF